MGKQVQRRVAGRLAQGALHGRHHAVDIGPVGGGFQGIDDVPQLPQGLAQVGRAKAAVLPLLAQGRAGADAARAANHAVGAPQRRAALVPTAGHAIGEHAFARAHAPPGQVFFQGAHQFRVPGQHQLRGRFHRAAQAQHGQLLFALHDGAHRIAGADPIREKGHVEGLVLRQGQNPDLHLGQYSHPPLGAQHHFPQVGSG